MPKFVADLSDDDEVMVLPYIKPTPPMIVLSASEDEGEVEVCGSGAAHLSKTKESSFSSSFSSGSQRAERDGPNQRAGEAWKGKRKEGSSRRQKKLSEDGRASETEVGNGSVGERSYTADPVGFNDETNSVNRSSARPNEPILDANNYPVIHISTNIFAPSETAILDSSSRNSTPPNGLVDQNQSPTSSSFNPGKNASRRQSTLVKHQFTSFLRGLNLPPPPPNGKRKSSENSATEETPADPDSSTSVTEGDGQGFVTVTEEMTISSVKRKRIQKAASAPASSAGSPRRETPIDIQYNITTTPLDLDPKSPPSKPLKKTSRKSKEKESPRTKAAAKKRKQKDENSASKSKKKERSKSDGANVKRKRMNNDVPSSSTKLKNKFPEATLSTTPSSAFPSHWNDEMKKFYGTISEEDFDLAKIFAQQPDGKRHWRVMVNKSKRRHYSCDICKKWQHKTVHCPLRGIPTRCIYCSDPNHLKNQCGKNICLFCGASQRKMQQACDKCLFRKPKQISCRLCSVTGHDIDTCPDNWRRYHSTTVDKTNVELKLVELKRKLENLKIERVALEGQKERGKKADLQAIKRVNANITNLEEEIQKMNEKINGSRITNVSVVFKYVPRFQQYCCNCGIKGHNNIMCKAERPKPFVIPNKTFVIRELDSTAPLSVAPSPPTPTSSSASVKTPTMKTPETHRNRRVVFSPDDSGSATITIGEPLSTKNPTSCTQNENSRTKSAAEPQNISAKPLPSSDSKSKEQQSQIDQAHAQKQRMIYEESQRERSVPLMTRSSQPKFYEDEMPTSFDIDERTIPRGIPSVPPPLFQFPPMQFPPPGPGMRSFFNFPQPQIQMGPPIWSDGSGRIQYPSSQQREIIHVPVPVPVPAEEYERFARHGFPSQFAFPPFFQSTSNPYVHQQIPPPFSYVSNTMPKAGPGAEQSSTIVDSPPSPDSTENVSSPPPITVAPATSSPDIEFLEEMSKVGSDGNEQETATDETEISLLPSEWDLFCKDKGKSNLVDILSRKLGVSIKVCRLTMTITISGGDPTAKNISKRNIVQFLQSEAASIQFKPDFSMLPEDIPASQPQSTSQRNGNERLISSSRSLHQSQSPQDYRQQNVHSSYPHYQNTHRRGFDRSRGNRYNGAYRSYRDDRDPGDRSMDPIHQREQYRGGRGRGNYGDGHGNYDDRGRYKDRNSYQSPRNNNSSDSQGSRRTYDRPRRYFDSQQ